MQTQDQTQAQVETPVESKAGMSSMLKYSLIGAGTALAVGAGYAIWRYCTTSDSVVEAVVEGVAHATEAATEAVAEAV